MSTPQADHDSEVDQLSKAQESTGRQDIITPEATAEQSDTTRVDMNRGARVWLGFMLVGVLFIGVLVYSWLTR